MTTPAAVEPTGRVGHEAGTFDPITETGVAVPRRPDHVSDIDWTRTLPEGDPVRSDISALHLELENR